jgi:3-deoxy-D-manno-octulosonate 8-phosphate phosphatase (KDO 8-P phosphatase)
MRSRRSANGRKSSLRPPTLARVSKRRESKSTPSKSSQSLRARLGRIRLFLCDVDGILTDATVAIGSDGESKSFCLTDGLGLRLLQESGVKVGWISGRPSPATEQRARELRVDFLYQSRDDKIVAAEAILAKTGMQWKDVCYMGDDIVDLGMLKRAGVAVAVPGAIPEAKSLADFVTHAAGGRGAVREVVEMILKAQNKWDEWVRKYSA